MKHLFVSSFLLLTSHFMYAQLPESDIWLLDIRDSSGVISLINPINITNHKGYDNQPAFSLDGTYVLYSSQVDGSLQTDIYKYDIYTKSITPFIQTPTSEYSPTFMPDGKNISVVMVEKDSTQRLWKFPIAGGASSCIMPNVKEVGYHSWINKDSVAVYLLTKPAFTLQLADVRTQKTTVLSDTIGRCMRMHKGLFWYTTKVGILNNVFEYHSKTNKSDFKGVIESEDYCFYKNDIWSCSEHSIVSGYMSSQLGAMEISNLEAYGIKKITRIAISPDRKRIAVVSNK